MRFFILIALIAISTISCAPPIPVIIDTDIGTDIDDTWALAYLLNSKEIDIKLVLTESHNTPARAKVAAKFLTQVGRTDIPIGVGFKQDNWTGPTVGALFSWAENFSLSEYRGKVFMDGIGAMVDIINDSPVPVIILVIAPCPNIFLALQSNPYIVNNSYIFAMGGSVFTGYDGQPPPVAEYNIRNDVIASESLYNASWSMFSAPLDITVFSQIGGEVYKHIARSRNVVTRELMDNYEYWFEHCTWSHHAGILPPNPINMSSTLHDLVAASMVVELLECFTPYYNCFPGENQDFNLQDTYLLINSSGFTNIDIINGRMVVEALSFVDQDTWTRNIAKVLQ